MDAWALESNTLASAASILINNVIDTLNKKKVSSQELETAIKPFAVIQWNREIISRIGIDKINRILGRLKRSQVCKKALRLAIDHFHTALADNGVTLPNRLTEWLVAITKYSLNTLADFDTWAPAIERLEANDINNPLALSNSTLPLFNALAAGSPHAEMLSPYTRLCGLNTRSIKG